MIIFLYWKKLHKILLRTKKPPLPFSERYLSTGGCLAALDTLSLSAVFELFLSLILFVYLFFQSLTAYIHITSNRMAYHEPIGI